MTLFVMQDTTVGGKVQTRINWTPIILIALALVAIAVFATLLFSRSGNEGLVSGTENLKPVAGTENLKPVNPNWDFQNTAPAPAVVPPSVRSDFKAEYKETASAKGKIDFEFRTSNDQRRVSWQIMARNDKPLFVKTFSEQRDVSGKVIYNDSSDIWLGPLRANKGEKLLGGLKEIEQTAKSMTLWFEVKDVE